MSAKVVRFPAHRVKAAADDAGFLGCPQCSGDEFAVVCRGLPLKPFVASLVCAVCDPPFEIGLTSGAITSMGPQA